MFISNEFARMPHPQQGILRFCPGFWVGPSCALRTLAGVCVQIVLRCPGRRCLECREVVSEPVRWDLSSLCGQMLRDGLPEPS